MKSPKSDSKDEQTEIIPLKRDDLRNKILDAEVQDFMELGKKTKKEWANKHAQRQRMEKIKQEKLNKDIAELRDDHIEKLKIPPVYSIYEVMHSYEENNNGSITLPLLLEDGEPKIFENKTVYEKW